MDFGLAPWAQMFPNTADGVFATGFFVLSRMTCHLDSCFHGWEQLGLWGVLSLLVSVLFLSFLGIAYVFTHIFPQTAADPFFSGSVSARTRSEDVLTAEQRERRMREVEAEVAQLVGWGSEEAGGVGSWGFTNRFT